MSRQGAQGGSTDESLQRLSRDQPYHAGMRKFIRSNIYARNGMLTHALPDLPTIAA
jgi:hypothetical protein